jgi:nucleoside triphosphatase
MEQKQYPEVTVGVLIFNKEGKVFLMVSPKWLNSYGIPGGHIEMGETVEETAKREIMEEVGLEIEDIEFLFFQEAIFTEEFYKKKHFIFLDYIAKAKTTNVTLDGRECMEYVWVALGDALKLPLNSYTRNTIIEYKKRYNK